MNTTLKTEHGNDSKPLLVSEGTKIPITSPHDPEKHTQHVSSPHDPEEHSKQPIPSPHDPEKHTQHVSSPHDPEEHSEQPIPSPHDPEEHSEQPIPSPHDPDEEHSEQPIPSPHDPEVRPKPTDITTPEKTSAEARVLIVEEHSNAKKDRVEATVSTNASKKDTDGSEIEGSGSEFLGKVMEKSILGGLVQRGIEATLSETKATKKGKPGSFEAKKKRGNDNLGQGGNNAGEQWNYLFNFLKLRDRRRKSMTSDTGTKGGKPDIPRRPRASAVERKPSQPQAREGRGRKSSARPPRLEDEPGSPKMKKGTEGKRRQSMKGKKLVSKARKFGSHKGGKMQGKYTAKRTRDLENREKTRKSPSRKPSLDDNVNRNPGSHQNKGTDGKKKQYMIGEKLVSKARKLESHKGGKMLGKYAAKLRKDFENNKKTRKSPSRKPSLDDNVNRNPGSHNKGTEGKRRQSMIGKMLVSKAREYGSHKGGEMLGKYAPKQTRDLGNKKKTRKSPPRKPSLDDNVNRNPGSHNKGTEGKRRQSMIGKMLVSKAREYGSHKGGEMLGKYAPKQTRDLGNKKKTRKSPSRKPSLDDNVNRNPGSHNKGTKGKRKQSKIGKRLASLTRKYGSQNVVKMLKLPASELRKFERNKKTIKSRSREPYTLIPSLDEGVNRNPGSHQNKGTEGKKKQYMIGEKLVSKARKLESHKGGKMLGKYAAKLRKDFENNKKTRKSPSRKPSLDDNVNRNPGSHQNKGTEGKRKRSKISKTVTSEVRKYGSSKFGEMLGKYGPYKSLTDPKTKSGGKASGIEKPKKRMGKAKVSSSKARKSGSSKGGKTRGKNAAEPARNLERKKKN